MNIITRDQFEDILFSNAREIVEKSSQSGYEYVTALYERGRLVAQRIITNKGTEYYGEVNSK